MNDDTISGDLPAFPNLGYNKEVNYNGMTLRDWFAGNAPDNSQLYIWGGDSYSDETESQYYCRARYQYADAMLKAREEVQ